MPYDALKHHRRSIRHPLYDYSSQGIYFVTVCTKWHACVLDDPALMDICIDVWQSLPGWFPNIMLDEFVIMPNHAHFLVWLAAGNGIGTNTDVGAHPRGRPDAGEGKPRPYENIHVYNGKREKQPDENESAAIPHDWEIPLLLTPTMNPTLGNIVGTWKSLVANTYLAWINKHALDCQAKFWQHNYHERIIRNDRALEAVRHYIRMNPDRWSIDPDNPQNTTNLLFPETTNDYFDDIKRNPHS